MARSSAFRTLVRLIRSAGSQSIQMQTMPAPTAPKKQWSRRRFLRYSALAGGAAVAATAADMWQPAFGYGHPRIAIIGGGMAGLNAAYQLKKLGLRATVYEAKPHLGGRIQSREGLVNPGLVNDLGGCFINQDHEDVLALAQEFNLKLFNRFESADASYPKTAFYYEGQPISEVEMAENLRPLAAQIATDAALLDADFDAYAQKFDVISVADYLNQYQDKILAPFVRALVEAGIRTEYGVEPEDSSALQLLFNLPTVTDQSVEPLSSDETFCIEAGSGKLIDSLHQALAGQIRTGYRLQCLQSHHDGFRLMLGQKGGNPVVVDADYVILAVPFPALRRVDFQVNLPNTLLRFIQEVELGRNEKLFAGFKDRRWQQETGFTIDAWTDLSFAQLWEDTQRQPERPDGVLTFFMGGQEVDAAISQPQTQGRQFLAQLNKQLPGIEAAQTGDFFRTNWANDADIGGGYTSFKPGQYLEFSEFLYIESEDPEERVDVHMGNLVFAGEHLSDEFYGYMNGAAQTGRLAAEVVASLLQE